MSKKEIIEWVNKNQGFCMVLLTIILVSMTIIQINGAKHEILLSYKPIVYISEINSADMIQFLEDESVVRLTLINVGKSTARLNKTYGVLKIDNLETQNFGDILIRDIFPEQKVNLNLGFDSKLLSKENLKNRNISIELNIEYSWIEGKTYFRDYILLDIKESTHTSGYDLQIINSKLDQIKTPESTNLKNIKA